MKSAACRGSHIQLQAEMRGAPNALHTQAAQGQRQRQLLHSHAAIQLQHAQAPVP
jgi:hypothetical protein